MREEKGIFKNIDWVMVMMYVALVGIGLANIYAAIYNEQHPSLFDFSQRYGKQLIWIASAFAIGGFILFIEPKVFPAFSLVFYAISLLLLVTVLLVGKTVSGSKSWIDLGGFDLQPSEFAKIAVALGVARYLSTLGIRMDDLRTKFITFLIIGIPAMMILLQDDTGSALVFGAFVFVLYREGLSGLVLIVLGIVIALFVLALMINKWIIIGLIAGIGAFWFFLIKKNRRDMLSLAGLLLLVIGFIFSVDYAFHNILEDHQRDRIDVLIGKETNLKGAGYNVNQSKIAIGSGRILGKGYLQGTQTKYNFVPEQSTDFIFCTVGEEWGFVGSVAVVGLFMALILRIINSAERQRSHFTRIYGYGVASILFMHFMINIGMTLGLAPVIGIPLPYVSYGGSSLWAFTILLFIYIRMDANRLHLV